jgi:L-asparaginase
MADRPRVVIILTGGTIAMLPDRATGAAVPSLHGQAVLDRAPRLADIADLEVVDWGLVPASHLRFGQLLAIGGLIQDAARRPGVSGVVVVQGTDVMEETAFAWDLLHAAEASLVVVGAMRHAGETDDDGPRNLMDAVRVAADPRMRGQGAVVVMGRQVHPADDVVKADSQALDAFIAPNDGPLARVDTDGVVILRSRGRRRVLPHGTDRAAEPVVLVTAVVSSDGSLIRAAVEGGAVGIVVEATGAGNTDPDHLRAASEAMARGLPVVLTSRCHSGGVGPLYGFEGGGRTWQEAGVILAGTLSGPKARVALALGLGAGLGRHELADLLGGRAAAMMERDGRPRGAASG